MVCALPRDDLSRCSAHNSAVQRTPNDADQILRIGFAQACIGASGTARAAVETLFDTAQEDVVIQVRRLWMQLEDLFERHLTSPRLVLAAFVRGKSRLLAIRPSRRGGTSI